MATYLLTTDFGMMHLEVKVRRVTDSYSSGVHYDKDWCRTVTLTNVDDLCKVNRQPLRFMLCWRARAKSWEAFDKEKIYDVSRIYTDGYAYKIGGGEAPKGAAEKLNTWANEFVDRWLEANPVAWATAEKEGRAADAVRLEQEVIALQKKIAAMKEEAKLRELEAASFAAQEGARIVAIGNVTAAPV